MLLILCSTKLWQYNMFIDTFSYILTYQILKTYVASSVELSTMLSSILYKPVLRGSSSFMFSVHSVPALSCLFVTDTGWKAIKKTPFSSAEPMRIAKLKKKLFLALSYTALLTKRNNFLYYCRPILGRMVNITVQERDGQV